MTGIKERVIDWLEPVLKKNGDLAGLEEFTLTPDGTRAIFTFKTQPDPVSELKLGAVYYPTVVNSLVEAFEIPRREFLLPKEPHCIRGVQLTVPLRLLREALNAGTAWTLRLVPGDLVSITGWATEGRSWPLPTNVHNGVNWLRWHRTIGIVTRGPANPDDVATVMVLSSTDDVANEVGSLTRAHPGFKNYRRLRSSAHFSPVLSAMAQELTSSADRVSARLH